MGSAPRVHRWKHPGPLVAAAFLSILAFPMISHAEWYVAPQFGVNFADRLKAVQGTGQLEGLEAPNFDLQNSYAVGGKIGYYPSNGPFGLEADVLYSTPHIKNLDDIPGIHYQVTNIGVHILARYPGKTYQPYLGLGPAILVSQIANSPTTQRDSDVTVGFNALAGIRAFVTPNIAVFTEYKYTIGTPDYENAFGPGSGFRADYQAQQLVFGISYHFSGNP